MNGWWWYVLKGALRFLVLFAVISMVLGCYWSQKKFGQISWEQALFHLQIVGDGLAGADAELGRSFARQMFWAVVLTLLLLAPSRSFVALGAKVRTGLTALGKGASVVRSGVKDWRVLSLMLVGSLLFAGKTFGALDMFEHPEAGEVFGKYYVDPGTVALQAGSRRNLVLVYVESLEKGYADADSFGRNLLADLQTLSAPEGGSRIMFPEMYQSVGTGWTIAGILSTQCGVPLHSVLLGDGNRQGEMVSRFMPGAVCLGDALQAKGYRNVFMHGPYNGFAGVRTFLATHGYGEVYGREYWQQRYGQDHMNGWGLYDADLLREGASKFDELAKSGQPFNLTLLTIDTHGPDGFLNPECQAEGLTGFTGVVACTAGKVAALVRHIQASPAAGNTTVVVMGDHLAMRNPVSDILAKHDRRGVFNLILTPERLRPAVDSISRFDMLPTMLAAMGWSIPQDRLGLGYNGFSAAAKQRGGDWQQRLEAIAGNKSPRYLALWREQARNK